jgi:PAS domain S-box-containing protein
MTWHFQTYAVAYIVNALFAALFCIFAWRRRSTPGAVAFALLMLAIADWTFLRALEATVVETWAKVLWAKLEYTGIASVGVLWLLFSARFSNQDKWLTKKTMGLLWVLPVLAVPMALSNDWHRLLWTNITPGSAVGSSFLIYHHGPWFWVVFSYTYLTLLAGSFLLVRAIVLYPRLYRRQIFPLMLGVVIPWLGNLIYVSGKSPVPGMDLTPFFFTAVGFIYYWSIFRSRLFEIVPIARDLLIENMDDGVIVLDTMDRVIDLNPAARRLLGVTNKHIGNSAEAILGWLPLSVTRPKHHSMKHVELTVERDIERSFTFDISPLVDRNENTCGHLILMRDVTEQKKAQGKLSESERRYREHVEDIGDIVYVLDKNRNFKYINSALGKHIGYSFSGSYQKSFSEIFTQPSYHSLGGLLDGQEPGEWKRIFEVELSGGDNGKRFFEVVEKTITDGDSIMEIHGIGRDITERKRMEEEIREREERYRDLVENIEDIIYVTDSTGKIIFLNSAFERISGYTREEMAQKNYMEILTPESLKKTIELFKRQKKGQDVGVFEMSFFDKNRAIKTIEVREKHILEGGQIVEVHGLGRDITERKRAEEALRRSEERHRTILRTAMDGFWIADMHGHLLEVNEAYCRMSGYSRQELLSMSISDLEDVETSADTAGRIQRIVAQGEDRFETRHRRKDGGVLQMMVSVQYRPSEEGHLVAFLQDITEKRNMELQLLQTEKLSAVGTMISGVAHELNNPLTSIIGNAQLLAKRNVPEEIKNKLNVILKESIRSSKIVGGLLAFAREHKPERQMTNINVILMESLKLREYDLKVSNIDVQMSASGNLPETFADPYQLQQVFINLINNARDALSGRDRGGLAIRTSGKDGLIMIEFEDNGPGIPEKLTNKIFDPFFTTKETGKGTGLGLSMSYGIIKEHGGTISVESKPGKGAKFVVTLPVTESAQPALEEVSPPAKSSIGTRTVLVVDDEESLRNLVFEALTEGGFLVEIASSGEEAINLLKKRQFDAVISDIKMPGIGGKSLFLYIQKHYPDIAEKIIFMTGDVLNKDTQLFLQTTNNRFIEKPFDVDALIPMLDDMI